ncbi:MAG: InlB B-repeat-containing protein [Ruminococcus sp.]
MHKNTPCAKNKILAFVAVILLLASLSTVTFSWIEGSDLISISNGVNIVNTVSASKKLNVSTSATNEVDLSSYIDNLDNLSLAPAKFDAENKKIMIKNTADGSYRDATTSDIGTNYIEFDISLNIAEENTSFLFTADSKITVNDSTLNPIKVVFSFNGEFSDVFSAKDLAGKEIINLGEETGDISLKVIIFYDGEDAIYNYANFSGKSVDFDLTLETEILYYVGAHAVTNAVNQNSTGGTVTLTSGDISIGPINTTVTRIKKGSSVTFTAQAKEGYKFIGWYSMPASGTKISSDLAYTIQRISANTHCYARFMKIYTVSVTSKTDGAVGNAGGTVTAGDGTQTTYETYYGQNVTIKATSNTGYDFINWTNVVDGTALEGAGEVYTITGIDKDYNLYGNFKIKKFNIEAHAVSEDAVDSTDGGTVSFTTEADSSASVTTTVNYNGSVTFKAFVNSDDGYEFKGWFSTSDCTGTAVSTATSYTVSNIKADTTLYASFKLKRYTVNAYAVSVGGKSGGTVSCDTQSGESITVSAAHGKTITLTAKRNGAATFLGWYTAETGGTLLSSNETYAPTITSNLTAYARFEVTDITTTIYFAERDGFTDYYAWVYDKADSSIKHTVNTSWPGDKLSVDTETGYYKFSFTTTYTGSFRTIISNGSGTQYPASNQPGLEGEYGKTYLFKGTELNEFNPVFVTVNAVSVDLSGTTQTNGFTGGSIKVGSTSYSAEKRLVYNSGDTFAATAEESGNYEFVGWYTNAACTGNAVSTENTLSVTVSSDTNYYAKFVEQEAQNIIYLKPNSNWTQASARFAVYLYKGSSYTWIDMTDAGNGYYSAILPEGYTSIIFCRMNPSSSANSWDNRWNQTNDLTIPTDGTNCYTIADGAWSKGDGTWSTYTP